VNREYRKRPSTHSCRAPVLRISEAEVFVSYLHYLGAAHQEVQDPVAQGGVLTQGPELNDELEGTMVLKDEL
jgi:hypothetical protein